MTTGMARGVALDALQNLVSVEPRQLQVKQDELRQRHRELLASSRPEEELYGLDAVARDVHAVCEVGGLECMQGERDVVGIVLDEEDVGAAVAHAASPVVK